MNQNKNENLNIEQQPGVPGEVADVAIPGRVRLWHTHPKALVGAGVAVVLALAGGGAYAWNAHSATQAKESYSQAVEAEASAFGQLEAARQEYSPLMEGCAEKAQDPSLCETLEKALADAGDLATVGKDASKVNDLDEATEQVEANTKKITTATASVEEAGEGVNASIEVKALAGLVSAYEAAVGQGQQVAGQAQALIDSSAGQVADDSTRQTLATTLAQLNEALAAEVDKTQGDDVEKATATLTDLTSQVSTQMQAVVDSQTAWQQAQTAQATASGVSTQRQSAQQSAPSKPVTTNGNASSSSKNAGGTTRGTAPARGGNTSTGGSTTKPSTGGKASGSTSSSGGKSSSGGTTPSGGRWEVTYSDECGGGDTHGNDWIGDC